TRFSKEQEAMTLETALIDRQVAIQTLIGAGLPAVDTLGFPDPGTAGAAKGSPCGTPPLSRSPAA
ncbi:hypothetical protein, partial [Escherichia coli]|uniref:hypothetical protein n=1 Tax=Escherichia coli TaxID=562 RepID=UPI001952BECF